MDTAQNRNSTQIPGPGYSALLPRPYRRFRPTECGSYRRQHAQFLYPLVFLNRLVSPNVVRSLRCTRHWAHQERWSHYDRITTHSPEYRVRRSDIHCMTCELREISRSEANEGDAAQASRDSWIVVNFPQMSVLITFVSGITTHTTLLSVFPAPPRSFRPSFGLWSLLAMVRIAVREKSPICSTAKKNWTNNMISDQEIVIWIGNWGTSSPLLLSRRRGSHYGGCLRSAWLDGGKLRKDIDNRLRQSISDIVKSFIRH